MKHCPKCNRTYPDNVQKFCTNDGGRLEKGAPPTKVTHDTILAKYIFLDVVGFTRNRSIEAQTDIVEALNRIVKESVLEHHIPTQKLLYLPTGDGICIALLDIKSPFDIHLLIALGIIEGVQEHNDVTPSEARKFQVRIGINANIDNLVIDINDNRNIAGAGISMASRIMGLADGNQILLGQSVYDTLRYRDKYMSTFKPFQATLKHDLQLPVYQFVGEGFTGLSINVPKSFQPQTTENKEVGRFFGQISFNGVLALFICYLAAIKRKPFNLKQLCESLKLLNYEYATGFLVACVSSGWLAVQQSEEIWTVLAVNEEIMKSMGDLLRERTDRINSTSKSAFSSDISLINFYFNSLV